MLAVILVVTGFAIATAVGDRVGSVLQLAFLATAIWLPAGLIVTVLLAGCWGYLFYLRHDLVGTPGGIRMLIS